jgi:hypothetical protein
MTMSPKCNYTVMPLRHGRVLIGRKGFSPAFHACETRPRHRNVPAGDKRRGDDFRGHRARTRPARACGARLPAEPARPSRQRVKSRLRAGAAAGHADPALSAAAPRAARPRPVAPGVDRCAARPGARGDGRSAWGVGSHRGAGAGDSGHLQLPHQLPRVHAALRLRAPRPARAGVAAAGAQSDAPDLCADRRIVRRTIGARFRERRAPVARCGHLAVPSRAPRRGAPGQMGRGRGRPGRDPRRPHGRGEKTTIFCYGRSTR